LDDKLPPNAHGHSHVTHFLNYDLPIISLKLEMLWMCSYHTTSLNFGK